MVKEESLSDPSPSYGVPSVGSSGLRLTPGNELWKLSLGSGSSSVGGAD